MNIAIIDDELYFQTKLRDLIIKEFPAFLIDCYSDVIDLLESNKQYDLLLLDIEMPNMNGMEFAKTNKNLYKKIIYVTSHIEKIYDAFDHNILGFIHKEQIQEKLINKINEIKHYENIIKISEQMEYIKEKEIIYIFSFKGHLEIETIDKSYKNSITIKDIRKRLSKAFFMVNRSEIINLNMIKHINKLDHTVTLTNGIKCEISRRRWNDFKIAYNRWVNEL